VARDIASFDEVDFGSRSRGIRWWVVRTLDILAF